MQSLILYLENELLQEGMYETITSGNYDYLGNNLAKLEKVSNDINYGDNIVYQSPYRDWVYETSLTMASGYSEPIIASGVYISGVFYGKNDNTYGHYIDYLNGRVIFKQSHNLSDVYSDYARKIFTIIKTYPNKDVSRNIGQFNRDILTTVGYPSGVLTLPAIFIQCNTQEIDGYQLGGGQKLGISYDLHIMAYDDTDCINLSDFLISKKGGSIKVIDFNNAPFPLNEWGDYSTNYLNYSGLKSAYPIYDAEIIEIRTKRANIGLSRYITTLNVDIFKT
jgi:hypothetical protein